MVTPLARSTPSTSAPSSSTGGMTLEAIVAQLEHMDAHLNTLSDELCQVNSCVGRIIRRQAVMGGFTASPSLSPSPSPQASEDEDASSSGDKEMTASQ